MYDQQPTIVRLDSDNFSNASSFEEAFGEHSSNAGGRDRRHAKKQARAERKNLKTQTKIERKQSRLEDRLDNRSKRGSMLGNILTGGVSGLTKRAKNKHKAHLLAKQNAVQNGPQASDEQQAQDGVDLPQGSDEQQDQGTDDSGSVDSSSQENVADSTESGDEGDQDGNSGQPEFQDESFDEETSDGEQSYGVDGKKRCDMTVKDLAAKIVWNNELLSRTKIKNEQLQRKLKMGSAGGVNASNSKSIASSISANKDLILKTSLRIDELNNQLDSYAKQKGVSDREIDYCMQLASGKLHAVKNNVTEVDKSLDADISNDRIVVEPKHSADGTGLKAIDDRGDYDAPSPTVVEIKSNADGDKRNINYKAIAIGLGVAAVGIWALNKFVFKTK